MIIKFEKLKKKQISKNTLDIMPFSITHMMLMRRNVCSNNRTTSVVDAEDESAINHLQKKEITSPMYRHKNAWCATRFDLHADVNIQTDAEILN